MTTKKTNDRPHNVIRTNVTAYRFSAGKASESRKKREGTARQPPKLPTSVEELQQRVDDALRDKGGA